MFGTGAAALFSQEAAEAILPGETKDGAVSALRDQFFLNAASGEDTEAEVERDKKVVVDYLRAGNFDDAKELYAAFEYLSAARSVERTDLREEDPRFFSSLPIELLLNLKPKQVEHPDWQTHVAALALVSLDPNLDSSQFLQAWAIEDRQTIHEGEGVAYELLWADPYLPGVGYQNLDPWLYDRVARHACRPNELDALRLLDPDHTRSRGGGGLSFGLAIETSQSGPADARSKAGKLREATAQKWKRKRDHLEGAAPEQIELQRSQDAGNDDGRRRGHVAGALERWSSGVHSGSMMPFA